MKHKYQKIILIILVCILLYFIWKNLRFHYSKEGFLDTNYDKTIYLLWQNKIKHQHGFGDSLRGAISTYQYCKDNNVNLKIDATDDICSSFLKNVVADDYNSIKNKDVIMHINDLNLHENLNNELSKSNIIYIYSNTYPFREMDDDDILFAKYICEPKMLLKNEVDAKINNLPNNYGIKHFRFNDTVFKNDLNEDNPIFKKSFELLKSDYNAGDVLLSNSQNFIKYAKDKLRIKTVECNNETCKAEHIGESTNYDSVKNTFIDFFIICNAKYIKSYTTYDWPSNFVFWPSKIYKIPFDSIKL